MNSTKKMTYKNCSVPVCTNTSIKTPEKHFVCVPKNPKIRQKWLKLARRNPDNIGEKSNIFFCEDHFDMEKDMANYSRFTMGFSKRKRMVTGVLPSKFHCQQDHRIKIIKTTKNNKQNNKQQSKKNQQQNNSLRKMCDASTSRPALHIQPTAAAQAVDISEAHITTGSQFITIKIEPMDSPDHLNGFDNGMASDLFVDHQFNEEVVGPTEIHNHCENAAIKVEPDDDDDDDALDPMTLVTTDLYEDHKVNEEMVIGPTVLQEPDLKFAVKQKNCKKTAKKYSCDYCAKQLVYNGSLEVKMNVHNREKSCYCFLCDTQYRLNKDLTKHISEVHVENGKYPCKICNKKIFSKATKLRTHLKLHFNQKFKCSFCDKGFQT